MNFYKKRLLQNLEPEANGGGFDMAAAVDSIGSDMGFGKTESAVPGELLDVDSDNNEGLPEGELTLEKPEPVETVTPAPASDPAAPPATAVKPPVTWTPAAAAKFAAADPEIQQEVLKREADMLRGIEQYRGAARFASEVQALVKPVESLLAQNNVTPQVFLGNLVQAHLRLSGNSSPEEKTAMARSLLSSYGISLGPADPANEVYIDPQVQDLRATVNELQSKINGSEARTQNEVRAKIGNDIKVFAEDPANPYFDEVADDIALLIRGSGGQMPLREAYDRAVRSNPVTYAKEVAKANASAIAEAKKVEAERVAKAKAKTSVNVKAGGHQGSSTAVMGSMEDTLAATMQAIKNRA